MYLATALLSGFLACSVLVYITARVSKQVMSKGSGGASASTMCSSMEPACKTKRTYTVILQTDHTVIGDVLVYLLTIAYLLPALVHIQSLLLPFNQWKETTDLSLSRCYSVVATYFYQVQ